MGTALQFALLAMDIVPRIIAGAAGAAQAFENAHAVYKTLVAENRDPTAEEWDALNAEIRRLEERILSDEQ